MGIEGEGKAENLPRGRQAELEENLEGFLSSLQRRAVVGVSGGVDSALVLAAAARYSPHPVHAVTALTPFLSKKEMDAAAAVCHELGMPLIFVRVELLDEEEIRYNRQNRCYFCKRRIYSAIRQKAAELGAEAVLDGTNLDDLGRHRPGLRALKELQIATPLASSGLTKEDVRGLAHAWGLSFWNRPSFSCLAVGMPAGSKIDEAQLAANGSGFYAF